MNHEPFGGRKAEQVTPTLACVKAGRRYVLSGEQILQFVHAENAELRGGTTNEEVLQMLIHRTETLDSEFPCEENKEAVAHMQKALQCFDKRAAKVGTRVATSDVDRV